MNPFVRQVADFHRKFGVPVNLEPEIPSEARLRLRRSLIEEESQELCHALILAESRASLASAAMHDLPKIADGIADLIYVCIGTALELGIPLEAVFDEVHRTNMLKEGGATRADGKILKPEGWKPPDIAKILRG